MGMVRDVDLKSLLPGRDIAAEIPLCNSQSSPAVSRP
jgi:hypothetical protein